MLVYHEHLDVLPLQEEGVQFLQMRGPIQLLLYGLYELVVLVDPLSLDGLEEVELVLLVIQSHLYALNVLDGVSPVVILGDLLEILQQLAVLQGLDVQLLPDDEHVDLQLLHLGVILVPLIPLLSRVSLKHCRHQLVVEVDALHLLEEVGGQFLEEALIDLVDVGLQEREENLEESLDNVLDVLEEGFGVPVLILSSQLPLYRVLELLEFPILVHLLPFVELLFVHRGVYPRNKLAHVLEESGFGELDLVVVAGDLGYLIDEVQNVLRQILGHPIVELEELPQFNGAPDKEIPVVRLDGPLHFLFP